MYLNLLFSNAKKYMYFHYIQNSEIPQLENGQTENIIN